MANSVDPDQLASSEVGSAGPGLRMVVLQNSKATLLGPNIKIM